MSHYVGMAPVKQCEHGMPFREHAHRLDQVARAEHISFTEAVQLYYYLTMEDEQCPEFVTTRLHVNEHGPGQDVSDRGSGDRGSVSGKIVNAVAMFGMFIFVSLFTFVALLAGSAHATTGELSVANRCDGFSLFVKLSDGAKVGATIEEVWGDVSAGGKGQNLGHWAPGGPAIELAFHRPAGTYHVTVNLVLDDGRKTTPEKVTAVVSGQCGGDSSTTVATTPGTTTIPTTEAPTTTTSVQVVEPSVPIIVPPVTIARVTTTTVAPSITGHVDSATSTATGITRVELPSTGFNPWLILFGLILVVLGAVGLWVGSDSRHAKKLQREARDQSKAKHPSNPQFKDF